MLEASVPGGAAGAWVIRPAEFVDGPGLTFPFLVQAMAGSRVLDVVPIEEVTAIPDGWQISGRGGLFTAAASWRPTPTSGHWDIALEVTARRDRPETSAALVIVARLDAGGEPRWLIHQTRYGGLIGDVGRLSHAWCLGLLLYASEVVLDMPELLEVSAA